MLAKPDTVVFRLEYIDITTAIRLEKIRSLSMGSFLRTQYEVLPDVRDGRPRRIKFQEDI
jgi:hypothetical protein